MEKSRLATMRITKTLYQNFFSVKLYNDNQQEKGRLRVTPALPLARILVPADAPVKPAYLVVIVEDAEIDKDNLLDFEEQTSLLLLKRFSTPEIVFGFCQFFYPSPAFIFENKNTTNT